MCSWEVCILITGDCPAPEQPDGTAARPASKASSQKIRVYMKFIGLARHRKLNPIVSARLCTTISSPRAQTTADSVQRLQLQCAGLRHGTSCRY